VRPAPRRSSHPPPPIPLYHRALPSPVQPIGSSMERTHDNPVVPRRRRMRPRV